MSFFSAKGINDIGSRKGCENMGNGSTYVMLNFNLSSMPVILRQGICLPAECA